MPPSNINTQQIYSIDLPEFAINSIQEHSGVNSQIITHDTLTSMCEQNSVPYLIVYETYVQNHFQTLTMLLEQHRVQHLLIFNHHPFVLDVGVLDKLDFLAQTQDIGIMVNGYYSKEYRHLSVYNFDLWEHSISHYFNLLLSNILEKRRNPSHLFMIQAVFKDTFRKTVGDFLKNSSVYSYFLPLQHIENIEGSRQLYQTSELFLNRLAENHGEGQYLNGLRSFGNGLPNFQAYEQIFCELVLETRNSGAWHFTEKTFRPISLGIPIIHLGDEKIHNSLLKYGYRLYDHKFYTVWHSNVDQQQKLLCLEQFLQHIKDNSTAQAEMAEIAQHNYQHFWNHRKNHYYKHLQHIFENVFGEQNLTHKVYKQMNF